MKGSSRRTRTRTRVSVALWLKESSIVLWRLCCVLDVLSSASRRTLTEVRGAILPTRGEDHYFQHDVDHNNRPGAAQTNRANSNVAQPVDEDEYPMLSDSPIGVAVDTDTGQNDFDATELLDADVPRERGVDHDELHSMQSYRSHRAAGAEVDPGRASTSRLSLLVQQQPSDLHRQYQQDSPLPFVHDDDAAPSQYAAERNLDLLVADQHHADRETTDVHLLPPAAFVARRRPTSLSLANSTPLTSSGSADGAIRRHGLITSNEVVFLHDRRNVRRGALELSRTESISNSGGGNSTPVVNWNSEGQLSTTEVEVDQSSGVLAGTTTISTRASSDENPACSANVRPVDGATTAPGNSRSAKSSYCARTSTPYTRKKKDKVSDPFPELAYYKTVSLQLPGRETTDPAVFSPHRRDDESQHTDEELQETCPIARYQCDPHGPEGKVSALTLSLFARVLPVMSAAEYFDTLQVTATWGTFLGYFFEEVGGEASTAMSSQQEFLSGDTDRFEELDAEHRKAKGHDHESLHEQHERRNSRHKQESPRKKSAEDLFPRLFTVEKRTAIETKVDLTAQNTWYGRVFETGKRNDWIPSIPSANIVEYLPREQVAVAGEAALQDEAEKVAGDRGQVVGEVDCDVEEEESAEQQSRSDLQGPISPRDHSLKSEDDPGGGDQKDNAGAENNEIGTSSQSQTNEMRPTFDDEVEKQDEFECRINMSPVSAGPQPLLYRAQKVGGEIDSECTGHSDDECGAATNFVRQASKMSMSMCASEGQLDVEGKDEDVMLQKDTRSSKSPSCLPAGQRSSSGNDFSVVSRRSSSADADRVLSRETTTPNTTIEAETTRTSGQYSAVAAITSAASATSSLSSWPAVGEATRSSIRSESTSCENNPMSTSEQVQVPLPAARNTTKSAIFSSNESSAPKRRGVCKTSSFSASVKIPARQRKSRSAMALIGISPTGSTTSTVGLAGGSAATTSKNVSPWDETLKNPHVAAIRRSLSCFQAEDGAYELKVGDLLWERIISGAVTLDLAAENGSASSPAANGINQNVPAQDRSAIISLGGTGLFQQSSGTISRRPAAAALYEEKQNHPPLITCREVGYPYHFDWISMFVCTVLGAASLVGACTWLRRFHRVLRVVRRSCRNGKNDNRELLQPWNNSEATECEQAPPEPERDSVVSDHPTENIEETRPELSLDKKRSRLLQLRGISDNDNRRNDKQDGADATACRRVWNSETSSDSARSESTGSEQLHRWTNSSSPDKTPWFNAFLLKHGLFPVFHSAIPWGFVAAQRILNRSKIHDFHANGSVYLWMLPAGTIVSGAFVWLAWRVLVWRKALGRLIPLVVFDTMMMLHYCSTLYMISGYDVHGDAVSATGKIRTTDTTLDNDVDAPVVSSMQHHYNTRHSCKNCGMHKKPRMHHCHICERCFPLRDHHCGFLGTCVCEDNVKFFLCWLLFLFLGLAYRFGLLVEAAFYLAAPRTCTSGAPVGGILLPVFRPGELESEKKLRSIHERQLPPEMKEVKQSQSSQEHLPAAAGSSSSGAETGDDFMVSSGETSPLHVPTSPRLSRRSTRRAARLEQATKESAKTTASPSKFTKEAVAAFPRWSVFEVLLLFLTVFLLFCGLSETVRLLEVQGGSQGQTWAERLRGTRIGKTSHKEDFLAKFGTNPLCWLLPFTNCSREFGDTARAGAGGVQKSGKKNRVVSEDNDPTINQSRSSAFISPTYQRGDLAQFPAPPTSSLPTAPPRFVGGPDAKRAIVSLDGDEQDDGRSPPVSRSAQLREHFDILEGQGGTSKSVMLAL
ncbi:unnamed protein product [Amoebophrya sp. A120]|nr:unnamed protein product [Amoebophrya sp. A120]|eukprot:GSA120T00012796001.1